MARKPAASKKPDTEEKPPLLEWIMGGLGLLLVIGCLAVIGKDILHRGGPPVVDATLQAVRGQPGAWLAEVEVRNTGGETAAAVEIEGALGDETASATLDYVPAHGTAHIVLGFAQDPRTGLTLRTRGWSEP